MANNNNTPFAAYFAGHNYPYDPARRVIPQFRAMIAHFQWANDSQAMRDARRGLHDAGAMQFDHLFGTDPDKLSAWQGLCELLRIEPLPESIKQCRLAIKAVYVNIYDLLDCKATGEPVKLFNNRRQLAKYSKKHKKVFPKARAKKEGLLKHLLRELFA